VHTGGADEEHPSKVHRAAAPLVAKSVVTTSVVAQRVAAPRSPAVQAPTRVIAALDGVEQMIPMLKKGPPLVVVTDGADVELLSRDPDRDELSPHAAVPPRIIARSAPMPTIRHIGRGIVRSGVATR
jgi:hypothetical protein